MDESPVSNWASGARKGPRRLIFVVVLILVIVGGGAGLFVWLFNSPGFRVAQEVYAAAPDVVNSAHYSTLNGGVDTLTIRVARDVTREEALGLQCDTVLPLLRREHLAARIVIQHPDNDFLLDGVECPPTPGS